MIRVAHLPRDTSRAIDKIPLKGRRAMKKCRAGGVNPIARRVQAIGGKSLHETVRQEAADNGMRSTYIEGVAPVRLGGQAGQRQIL